MKHINKILEIQGNIKIALIKLNSLPKNKLDNLSEKYVDIWAGDITQMFIDSGLFREDVIEEVNLFIKNGNRS